MKNGFKKGMLLAFTVGFSVGLIEVALRMIEPSAMHQVGQALPDSSFNSREDSVFMIDPEFGFRPKLGTAMYSEFGTLVNKYALEKRAGVTRILCMGDSVMARHILIDALKAVFGGEDKEWWNAGVESFNTAQEVALYRQYNYKIKPDRVWLFFHNNDFSTTPIAVPTEDGGVELVMPNMPGLNMNPWLFKHSRIYKRLLSLKWQAGADDILLGEVSARFEELKALLDEEGVPLTIVLLPIMKPYDEWKGHQLENREYALAVLEDLGIPWIDLMPALEEGVAAGIPLQESVGDGWHPSPELAAYFARYLKAEGLFE